MSLQRTLDVAHLPTYEISSQAPLWWGQLLLAFIEGAMFFILLAMYFYYRLSVDSWPPAGVQIPGVSIATAALALFLISCYGSYKASQGAKEDRRGIAI